MNQRPKIPEKVKLQLWANSCGHCMNPDCKKDITPDNRHPLPADMAHIIPHAEGGSASYDNLILLCKACSSHYEPLGRPELRKKLRQWKNGCHDRMKMIYELEFETFEKLGAKVRPLIEENFQVFTDYGPNTDNSEAYKLWKEFEAKLISNNAKIALLLRKNFRLLHLENQEIVQEFIAHANEFDITRGNFSGVRQKLFPRGILSLFGIREEKCSPPPSVNALQNFIAKLQKERNFIYLSIFPPELCYLHNSELIYLNLENRAEIQQMYFNKFLFLPKRTELRFNTLKFVLSYLNKRGIEWEFKDYSDLTTITLDRAIVVKFFEKYIVSQADVLYERLHEVTHIVNIYHWNGGLFTNEVYDYAVENGLEVMSHNEFFIFCNRISR